jgi:uncharacterized membrane protein
MIGKVSVLMMKSFQSLWVIPFLLAAVSWGMGVKYLGSMPDVMVTHWGIDGEPDGWSPRFWGVFHGSVMGTFIMLLLLSLAELHRKGKIAINSDFVDPRFVRYAVPIISTLIWLILLTAQYDTIQNNL